jgi:hypothetical protein
MFDMASTDHMEQHVILKPKKIEEKRMKLASSIQHCIVPKSLRMESVGVPILSSSSNSYSSIHPILILNPQIPARI